MSTWVGAIIETAGRADVWDIARKHGVDAASTEIPPYLLVECDSGFDFQASVRLAEAMSRELGAIAIGFVVQTTADVHEIHVFDKGTPIRRLGYSRDEDDGWVVVEGTPQPWEPAYFFHDDMLWDDMTDEDTARYEAARTAGDASAVLDLMHPSSTAPMHRVCRSFGLAGDRPHARWKKKGSFLSRLFGRDR